MLLGVGKGLQEVENESQRSNDRKNGRNVPFLVPKEVRHGAADSGSQLHPQGIVDVIAFGGRALHE